MVELASHVRQPLWTGVQEVAGLWLSAAWLAPAERNRRLFEAWRPGSVAMRFAQGDLLRFPAPLPLRCERLSGLALCLTRAGVLVGAPLTAAEAATAQGDVLLVDGAHVRGLRLADGQPLDLSLAIDIGDYALRDTFDCSQAVRPVDARALQGKDVRTVLGDTIPPPSAEQETFLRALAARREGKAPSDPLAQRLRGVAMRMVGGVAGALAGVLGAAGAAGAVGGRGNARPGAISARRPLAGPQAWRERLARFAQATRISHLLGWRQGAYLKKMLDLFDGGDLREALRHAVPLGGDRLGGSLGQAFGTPGPRSHLGLSDGVGPAASIGVGVELQEHLRGLYRRAFESLDRAGRIDEAVFVLAELLNSRQEALDYLEKHGRLAQAADLALRWDMPPATIVRLLLLAGDWDRAIQVARRDNEFAAVIAALGKGKPELVAKLRLAWGEHLADRGEWLAAVEAIWAVPQARHIATQWLQQAEQADTVLSARALVRRAALLPDTLAPQAPRLRQLVADRDGAPARTAMAVALGEAKETGPALQALAALLLPAVAADRAAGRNELGKHALNKLLERAADPFLRADLPAWGLPPPAAAGPELWSRGTALVAVAPAAGLQAIHDAAVLADDRYLVALGEAGAIVVDRTGRTVQRYAVPCYQLVVADNQQVALAVAPREDFSRIARLDLVNHAIADLGALRLRWFATRFDGAAWTVVSDGRILVVDTARSLQDVLWHVGELPGEIVAARFEAHAEQFLLRTRLGFERWNYVLPGRRLASRTTETVVADRPVLLRSDGVQQPRAEPRAGGLHVEWPWYGGMRSVHVPVEGSAPLQRAEFEAFGSGVLLAVHTDGPAQLSVLRGADAAIVLRVAWPDAPSFGARAQAEHVLFFDGQGRLLHVPTDGRPPRAITLA